jgi:DDE superfamily endonuclease
VTAHFPGRCFAFDQFGPLPVRPVHGSAWAPRNKPVRLPATYHRTLGIRYFHGCYSLADDQLWGVMRARKGADHTLAALKSLRAARPGGYRLFVILDNLSANKTPAIRRWADQANVELCFTPTSASWANPIEPQFGPVRTFVMSGSDYRNHTQLARRMQHYLRWRNANARHPDILAAQRRERARIRSERQQRWGRPKIKAA